MRTVLVGAVDSSRVALEVLIEQGLRPCLVVTLPRDKSIRHSDFVDLSTLSASAEIDVEYSANINSPQTLERIRLLAPDYVFVVGWSQICKKEFLSIARMGTIGYHPALLPRNRGRGLLPWTILLRHEETGATLFWMDEGVDSGPILTQVRFAVGSSETAESLYLKHMDHLRIMFKDACQDLIAGTPVRIIQDVSQATYCAKRTPRDGMIDWCKSADDIWTLIRATSKPYPGAFTFYKGKKLILWEAGLVGNAPYAGVPGQIQILDDKGALVQCGDRQHIFLKLVQLDGGPMAKPKELIKLHDKLGIDLFDLYKALGDNL